MPEPILMGDYPNRLAYAEALEKTDVLWKLSEPVDTPEIIAHASSIALANLQIITLSSQDSLKECRCAVLTRDELRKAQDWYLGQGLWPFASRIVNWGRLMTGLILGYPERAKALPGGQLSMERALDNFRREKLAEGTVNASQSIPCRNKDLQPVIKHVKDKVGELSPDSVHD